MPKKPTTFSMRMPEDINDRIQAYAAEHECTKAEAMSHFVRAGIKLEDDGPAPAAGQDQAKLDLAPLSERLDKMQSALDKAGKEQEAARQTAIIPADIRDRIHTYATEHSCTDEEALGYYARIGITMTADDRPVSQSDLADVAKKLDAIVADGAAKNEQLKSLSETVDAIRGYTEPEDVEVEGELADPAIEEAKDALEEERREAERDERTRKIINEAMDSYIERNKSHEPQQNSVVPALVAAVVALVIGLVVILAILLTR